MYGCVMNAVHTYSTSVAFAKGYFSEALKATTFARITLKVLVVILRKLFGEAYVNAKAF